MNNTLLMLTACMTLAICSPMLQAQDTADVENDDMIQDVVKSFKHPFMQVSIGNAMIALDGVPSIENDLTYGIDLGFTRTRQVMNSSVNYQYNKGLYLKYHMAPNPVPGSYTSDVWRFGTQSTESYGYSFSSGEPEGIYFDFSNAPLSWYSIVNKGSVDSLSNARMARFQDALRFGEASLASITLRASNNISFNAGFEWAQAYERHMFWYWAGSQLLEGIGDKLAEFFVGAIKKNSPSAVPIMHFILRNGIAFGFKALRQHQMNWPFTTAAPLNFTTYRIGTTIIF
ncbi:MAG: hypothetical protein HYX66_10205 [Ignavibacteria bacterium]|nr:hypothetical protein [Ignavibacteria bacterium]